MGDPPEFLPETGAGCGPNTTSTSAPLLSLVRDGLLHVGSTTTTAPQPDEAIGTVTSGASQAITTEIITVTTGDARSLLVPRPQSFWVRMVVARQRRRSVGSGWQLAVKRTVDIVAGT